MSAGKAGATAGLMIALLLLSRLIRVDVQNVRRIFYGLLRNHSPAQVTQCSAMQESGEGRGEDKGFIFLKGGVEGVERRGASLPLEELRAQCGELNRMPRQN